MSACPTCELPMVWSDREQRMWCCVYGDHPTLMLGPEPIWREAFDVLTGVYLYRRNIAAPGTKLIELLIEAYCDDQRAAYQATLKGAA